MILIFIMHLKREKTKMISSFLLKLSYTGSKCMHNIGAFQELCNESNPSADFEKPLLTT